MRMVKITIVLLLLCTVVGCRPFPTIKLACNPAMTDTSGWKAIEGAPLTLSIEYWADGECTATVVGIPSTPGAELFTGPGHGGGVGKPFTFPPIASADFKCEGDGKGNCYFRVTQVMTPGVSSKTTIENPRVPIACGTVQDTPIFSSSARCDVVVLATAPATCTARINGEGGSVFEVNNGSTYASFGQTRRLTARCEGTAGSGTCTYVVKAWCP
jgi:hypothetical protein